MEDRSGKICQQREAAIRLYLSSKGSFLTRSHSTTKAERSKTRFLNKYDNSRAQIVFELKADWKKMHEDSLIVGIIMRRQLGSERIYSVVSFQH